MEQSDRALHIREPVPPTAYLSFRQFPLQFRTSFAVRTTLPPLTLAPAIRQVVGSVNPAIPVARVITQDNLSYGRGAASR